MLGDGVCVETKKNTDGVDEFWFRQNGSLDFTYIATHTQSHSMLSFYFIILCPSYWGMCVRRMRDGKGRGVGKLSMKTEYEKHIHTYWYCLQCSHSHWAADNCNIPLTVDNKRNNLITPQWNLCMGTRNEHMPCTLYTVCDQHYYPTITAANFFPIAKHKFPYVCLADTRCNFIHILFQFIHIVISHTRCHGSGIVHLDSLARLDVHNRIFSANWW